jgi:hypothetical protein
VYVTLFSTPLFSPQRSPRAGSLSCSIYFPHFQFNISSIQNLFFYYWQDPRCFDSRLVCGLFGGEYITCPRFVVDDFQFLNGKITHSQSTLKCIQDEFKTPMLWCIRSRGKGVFVTSRRARLNSGVISWNKDRNPVAHSAHKYDKDQLLLKVIVYVLGEAYFFLFQPLFNLII